MGNLRHSIARTAAILTDNKPLHRFGFRTGVIASIDVGGALDGSDVLTVTIGADDIQAIHIDIPGWTPTVGDRVAVLFDNGSPVIQGRLTGAPDIS